MESINDYSFWLEMCEIKISGKKRQLTLQQNIARGSIIVALVGLISALIALINKQGMVDKTTAFCGAATTFVGALTALKSGFTDKSKLKTDIDMLELARRNPPPSDKKIKIIENA